MSSTIFTAAGGLSESFRKLVDACFENVDGVMVEKISTGYIVFGKQVSTMERAKEIIAEAKGNLNQSIKRA